MLQHLLTDHIPEILGISGAAIITIVAKYRGWIVISFRQPVERRSCGKEITRMCKDHPTMLEAIRTSTKISEENQSKLNKMDDKVDVITSSVARIEGFLQGHNGYSD